VETVSPLTEIVQAIKEVGGESFRYCYQCGKCDVVCPWNRVTDFSIRKIIRQAALGLPEIELDNIWRCTTCGNCQALCPRGVGQIEVGVAIRRIASTYGVFSGSANTVLAAGASTHLLAFDRPVILIWRQSPPTTALPLLPVWELRLRPITISLGMQDV